MTASPAQPYLLTRRVGLLMVPGLDRLLDLSLRYRPFGPPPAGVHAVVGWGYKGRFADDAAWASRLGLPYLALEDGFLRSIGLGDTSGPLGVCVDDLGIYYDASRPSRLEVAIKRPLAADELARGADVAARWRAGRLSKYNHAREQAAPVNGPFVLVVDQTFGDASIGYGMASAASFTRMLEAALDEHPGLPIVLKVHPDVIAGRKRAHFDRLARGAASRVTLLVDDAHPPALLESAVAVYVVTSQMGFEALLWNRPVRCFGMPFYAGWGLTQDEIAAPARRSAECGATLESVAHAALVEYARYLDPETQQRCEPERLMDWMAFQRCQRERFPAEVQVVGFSQWKQPHARSFLAGSTLRFVDRAESLKPGAQTRAVWGRPASPVAAGLSDAPLLRVEDGFLRSVGLGANWVQPLSLVIDRSGMYYDATAPSDIETLLRTHAFDDALLQRAKSLRETLVAAGITKYNVGQGAWQRPTTASHIVLVPGQVESDASIAYGTTGAVRTNLALLKAVRAARPNAYLIYKPHPDVVAQKRDIGPDEAETASWCDEVVVDRPMHLLLDVVDEVQVLTSLAGFEALLRGVPVVCHGMPFYAGWGLTTDMNAHSRRGRRLSLDELVAAALILYPTYVSRVSGAFTTPERAVVELGRWATLRTPSEPVWLRTARLLKRLKDRGSKR
ncbi:capsular polysaccharide biosynthesis protein [Methylibium petroleiphilum]|uniref:capsular polysaccharide biosynthesis protein n=1 Tax=Methylibium petroleiphilum TaxID=105560 RepID=UPI001ACBF3D6|nr:capsular polysaccharide biosynthesis protein [Methylibium petroleiphilum]MBN9204244.1 capsular polysaccharide biosynthesis protein [Methylibium petroleiphilum]